MDIPREARPVGWPLDGPRSSEVLMRMAHSRIWNVVPKGNPVGNSGIPGTQSTIENVGTDEHPGKKNLARIDTPTGKTVGATDQLVIDLMPQPISFHTETGFDGSGACAGEAGELTPGIKSIMTGYGQMVQGRVNSGWSCDLLTFMFNPMAGSEASFLARMADELQRVYSTFVTRTHRRPGSVQLDQLPLLIAAADLPVYKREKPTIPAPNQNGGLHYHGLLLVPANSRLRTPVNQHFEDNQSLYLGRDGFLQRIHVVPVTVDHARVVDYVFKSVNNGRLTYDQAVLILPNTL